MPLSYGCGGCVPSRMAAPTPVSGPASNPNAVPLLRVDSPVTGVVRTLDSVSSATCQCVEQRRALWVALAVLGIVLFWRTRT